MLRKTRLFTPGPTPLSPAVQEALGRPLLHHRSDEFRALFMECASGLKRFLKTGGEVLILSCSGTGAMEAAVVNALSPGDRMLALVAGHFGQRFADLGRAHGMDVRTIEAPWGEAVPPAAVARALDADPTVRAVFVQHSESSTSVRHDVQALARIVRDRDVLLVVDAISGAGAMPLETEAWGVDVVVVGAQKALSVPPGLAFITLSERAWTRQAAVRAPRFYFDLARERKAQAAGDAAWSPAVPLVAALAAALRGVEAMGGVDALVASTATLAHMARAAAAALGLPLLAPRDHGDALTALLPAEGVSAPALVASIKKEFGAVVAGGQGRLKGQILRLGHLGHQDAFDLFGLIAALEVALQRAGRRVEPGAGVAAAQGVYLSRASS